MAVTQLVQIIFSSNAFLLNFHNDLDLWPTETKRCGLLFRKDNHPNKFKFEGQIVYRAESVFLLKITVIYGLLTPKTIGNFYTLRVIKCKGYKWNQSYLVEKVFTIKVN